MLSYPQSKVTKLSEAKFLHALELGRAPTKGSMYQKATGKEYPTAQQHTKGIQGKACRTCWRKRYQRQAFEEEPATDFHGFGMLELIQNPQCPSARADLSSETREIFNCKVQYQVRHQVLTNYNGWHFDISVYVANCAKKSTFTNSTLCFFSD